MCIDLEDVIVAVGQKLEQERQEMEKWQEYKVCHYASNRTLVRENILL